MSRAAFTVEVDARCQRGFHLRYSVPGLNADAVGGAARDAWGDAVEVREERWGTQTVVRVLRPFRFEIRAGAQLDKLSLIHRHSSSPDQREAQRRELEALLPLLVSP